MWESEAVQPCVPEKPKLLFPTAIPRIPIIVGSADHERKRKVAIKCLELEEMLESQGLSQSEIETKVASFRALLLRQVTTANNNNNNSSNGNTNLKLEEREETGLEKHSNGNSSKSEVIPDKNENQKKKKKRRKESKHRKRKKEKRKHYCSSPSYSDYEPDNPLLKYKRRNAEGALNQTKIEDKDDKSKDPKSRKKKKRKHRYRSESRSRSRSPLGSRSGKRKTRYKKITFNERNCP